MYLGLGILLVTFALYMTGIMQPGIPIEELPRLWTLSAHEYLETVNHEFLHRPQVVDGWRWVALLGMGDYVNFIGIAILAAVTIVCYVGVLPSLLPEEGLDLCHHRRPGGRRPGPGGIAESGSGPLRSHWRTEDSVRPGPDSKG